MRSFARLDDAIGQVPARIVTKLSTIDVGRGSEGLYRDQLPGLLTDLQHRARVASIKASSAIEGIIVPDQERARRIIGGEARTLRTRSEQELAGYRDALDYLFTEDWRPLNPGLILHLHRLLYEHTKAPGGSFKSEDNLVVDRASDGSVTVRFRPVPAADTAFYVTELVERYRDATNHYEHHPVLAIAAFVLDFLVIHPFDDGNGRLARALTNAMLIDAGYGVSRYVSLEELIAESADDYYQALLESTHGWHEDKADLWPWIEYFVDVLAMAYGTFAERAASARAQGSKQERVRDYVLNHAPSTFRLAQIRQALPGVSDPTIRLALDQLRQDGSIAAEGTGRGAVWCRTSERDTEC